MDDAEYETVIRMQRQELVSAQTLESDLDLAFNLQVQETVIASLAHQPSSSSSPPRPPPPPPLNTNPQIDPSSDLISLQTRELDRFPPPLNTNPQTDPSSDLISLQTRELDRFHQEKVDSQISRLEWERIAADMRRRFHDKRFAHEINDMADNEWEYWGDEFERPMGEREEENFTARVYFKGLESDELVNGMVAKFSGMGVAVCDEWDRVLLKVSKPVGMVVNCRKVVELKAMVEALNMVVGMGVRVVDVFLDYPTLYNHVTGQWMVKQDRLQNLINQVQLLQRKFNVCNIHLVPRCNIRYVFKLARDAIDSQLKKEAEINVNKDGKEEACIICLEDTEQSQMFAVDECLHRFCFSCMKQHVEVKLLHGMLPSCPHDGCKISLTVESCRKFLMPKLLNIMIQRIKEESIPVTQKIYCPYPRCSALMSFNEAIKPSPASSSKQPAYDTFGLRKCIQCNGSFCINCKVPWHERTSCSNYKKLNPQSQVEEDFKLKVLARQKLWRQCIKCNHMIELAEGCFHITCRCGCEFCYTCGVEWVDKKATCSCPLWEEGNIIRNDVHHIMHDDLEEGNIIRNDVHHIMRIILCTMIWRLMTRTDY